MFNYRESRLTSITVNIRHLRIEKEKRKTKSYRISLRARLGFQVEAHNVAEMNRIRRFSSSCLWCAFQSNALEDCVHSAAV